jgi:hypothetical protein
MNFDRFQLAPPHHKRARVAREHHVFDAPQAVEDAKEDDEKYK